MSRIPLIYHTNIKFFTQYTHPMIICRGMDPRTVGCTENIYSIFRDKLLLLWEHVYKYCLQTLNFSIFIAFFSSLSYLHKPCKSHDSFS